MGIYLKVGGIDLSRFITANSYSVSSAPVYDEVSSYVNIYGEKVRKRTGHEARIKAVLYDVDEETASALSVKLAEDNVNVVCSAPIAAEGCFRTVRLEMSLDRVMDGKSFWTVDTELYASFVPEDGL